MNLSLSCSCGQVKGIAKDVTPKKTKRIVCLCDDCQAYAHFLGNPNVLDANGGTEVVPLYPCDVEITQGMDQLKCMRLTKKGIYRWYADCCKTPVANCPQDAKVPYVGLQACAVEGREEVLTKCLGPITDRIMGKFGKGPLPPGTHEKVPLKLVLFTILPSIIKGKILKKYWPSAFFTKAGEPLKQPFIFHNEH